MLRAATPTHRAAVRARPLRPRKRECSPWSSSRSQRRTLVRSRRSCPRAARDRVRSGRHGRPHTKTRRRRSRRTSWPPRSPTRRSRRARPIRTPTRGDRPSTCRSGSRRRCTTTCNRAGRRRTRARRSSSRQARPRRTPRRRQVPKGFRSTCRFDHCRTPRCRRSASERPAPGMTPPRWFVSSVAGRARLGRSARAAIAGFRCGPAARAATSENEAERGHEAARDVVHPDRLFTSRAGRERRVFRRNSSRRGDHSVPSGQPWRGGQPISGLACSRLRLLAFPGPSLRRLGGRPCAPI